MQKYLQNFQKLICIQGKLKVKMCKFSLHDIFAKFYAKKKSKSICNHYLYELQNDYYSEKEVQ